jgi:hypothetical protein
MARPIKQGLDYFSLDTDFLQNRKVRRIKMACGPQSISVLICLLCNIYRSSGYYILWDEDLPFLIADEIGVSEGAVTEIMKKALQVEFFNQPLYDRHKILTSKEIQNRYTKVCTDSKRKGWEIKEDFSMKYGFTPEETPFIPEETELSPPISTQRIVKNRIVKERREEYMPPGEPGSHTDEQKSKFSAFSAWIETNAPRVNKMKEPFTIDQFKTFREKFDPAIVRELLLQMHNWEPLLKKNRSAYLTLSNWYSRRDEVKRPLQKDELDDYKAKREKELERAKEINEGNL